MTKVKRRAPGFLLDVVLMTLLATPLWFLLDQQRGVDAVISGAVSAFLFTSFWHFIYDKTPGDRLAYWFGWQRGL